MGESMIGQQITVEMTKESRCGRSDEYDTHFEALGSRSLIH